MKQKLVLGILFCLIPTIYSWAIQDTLRTIDLKEFQIQNLGQQNPIRPTPNIHNLQIIGGRKTEVINLSGLAVNLAEKTGRTLFAKVPGAFIYDMDGTGNQINVSVRGLDGHRSWEFNVRQNGVMINTDIYGYPASHYSMPMEAVERIELIRGTGALQYGQQFGGMLNYVLKSADPSKTFSLENITSIGSFGMLANFISIGGTKGKWSYYGYFQKRHSNGYREGAESQSDSEHIGINYKANKNLNLKAEVSRSTYLYRIPGPLNDLKFEENPTQATRTRNYYSPEIWIPAISMEGRLGKDTKFSLVGSGVFGQRSSVTFDAMADVPDAIHPETNDYFNRNVDIDNYHTRTVEGRVLHQYSLGNIKNNLSLSSRFFNNSFDRKQRGKGTTGSDYDLSISGKFPRDMNLKSKSISFALENQVLISQNFSLSPGVRIQQGSSELTGSISYLESSKVPVQIDYNFITLGINAEYKPSLTNRFYAGISQANRPVLFQDIIPGSPLYVISSNLEDSFGYNSEIGWESNPNEYLHFNATLFQTLIGNRIGNLLIEEEGQFLIQKSNIGDSKTSGLELLWDFEFYHSEKASFSIYTSSSWMNARYIRGFISNGSENVSIKGNHVEAAPDWISRNGINYSSQSLQVSLQHQFVSQSFSDALNTQIPPPSGAVGPVPSYHLWDLQGIYQLQNLTFRASLLNILNKSYFTKRPQMYPGPGIWPSDGRSLTISIGIKI